MVEVSVTELRKHLLDYLSKVERGEDEIVVLRHGKPVARIVPQRLRPADLLGIERGQWKVTDPDDDLLSTGEEWELS